MSTRFQRLFDFSKEGKGASGVSEDASLAPMVTEVEPAPLCGNGVKSSAAPSASAMPLENIHLHLDGRLDAPSNAESASKQSLKSVAPKQDRRHRRRVKISAPVRIRQVNLREATEYDFTMTTDVSREGLLFETTNTSYERGQEVGVVFPYRPVPGETVKEQRGLVVRVARASERRYGVALAFVEGEPENEIVDTSGRPIRSANEILVGGGRKQLVIAVEADAHLRAELRGQLEREGYAVEAVANAPEALRILRQRDPVAIICEAEPFSGAMTTGSEMSGYDLCVVVRRNPKYARLPVVLTTRTGMPSDFATAHALGATVCVAKPYDLARMTNVLRMLIPAVAR
ncbi:MAG TPA: response regulator [Candidatus Acidoferrales bacterium]|nr:response regulator [Candidatus Acidoferrales bacterium]